MAARPTGTRDPSFNERRHPRQQVRPQKAGVLSREPPLGDSNQISGLTSDGLSKGAHLANADHWLYLAAEAT